MVGDIKECHKLHALSGINRVVLGFIVETSYLKPLLYSNREVLVSMCVMRVFCKRLWSWAI